MWTSTKEARLMRAVLEFATDCLAEGDIVGLRTLGLEQIDVEKLSDLRLGDLRYFRSLQAHALGITVERDRLYKMLDYINRTRAEEAQRDYLLAHDAPLKLLHSLYGMDNKECAIQRAFKGLPARVGRPREPTVVEEGQVWEAYTALGKRRVDQLSAADWIGIHRNTQASLRVIWQLINTWSTSEPQVPGAAPLPVAQGHG